MCNIEEEPTVEVPQATNEDTTEVIPDVVPDSGLTLDLSPEVIAEETKQEVHADEVLTDQKEGEVAVVTEEITPVAIEDPKEVPVATEEPEDVLVAAEQHTPLPNEVQQEIVVVTHHSADEVRQLTEEIANRLKTRVKLLVHLKSLESVLQVSNDQVEERLKDLVR